MTAEGLQAPMQSFIERLQDDICRALEGLDGGRFREDAWTRAGGGGGRTRVLEDGRVFEKAGVNVSVVHGELGEAFAKRLPGDGRAFFAAGLSLIIHPRSPLVPTVHANFRYIIHGQKAWFGGGTDLTPYYLFDEDARHFHGVLKAACDRHDAAYYPRFKKACDEYFWLKHREEARGVGGLFFEDIGGEQGSVTHAAQGGEQGSVTHAAQGGNLEREFAFVQDCGASFLPSYLPLVERRKDAPYSDAQRAWQEQRRGRYVEFNLLYDRGTSFGLETRGRVESILVSLPPRVRWVYDARPAAGSEEARLLDVLRHPRDWSAVDSSPPGR